MSDKDREINDALQAMVAINTTTTTNIREAATVEDALGIMRGSPRHQKLVWMLDEIMYTKQKKAEAIFAISELKDITDLEKVYLGYMLMQRIFILKVPLGERIMRKI